MNIKKGDEVRSDLDGRDYVVTRIAGNMVVLKLKNGEREILTGMDSLKMFYKKKEDQKP